MADEAHGTTTAAHDATAKSRDSVHTRGLLLQAARTRFARDGYSATTVRDIATDAGVNVALINRYFDSKEGLFEACLRHTAELLSSSNSEMKLERIVQSIVTGLAGSPSGDRQLQLLLLLRTSGDERADAIRRETLRSFAVGMAGGAEPIGKTELLRAEIAMATALGIVLLRSSSAIEPLASASADDLAGPIGEVIATLLEPAHTSA